MEPILDALTSQSVVIVAGKGGVGKTTVTAALAIAAARAGRSVLAVELDGKPQLAAWTSDQERLDSVSISPGTALEEYLGEHGFGRAAKRLSKSGVIDLLAAATPGINDVVVLGKIKQIERAGTYDLIIVDGPAAGHAISMLTSARGLIDVARGGPVRRQADEVDEMLTDPDRCGVVLVTLPETTPVNELIETAFDVEEQAEVTLNGIVVNQVLATPPLTASDLASVVAGAGAAEASAFIVDRRKVQDVALARLDAELPLTRLAVPLIATAELTATELATLAESVLGGVVAATVSAQKRSTGPKTKTSTSTTTAADNSLEGNATANAATKINGKRSSGKRSNETTSNETTDAGIQDVGIHETGTTVPDRRARSRPAAGAVPLAEVVARKDVLLCVGSGGVGKTTTAAALGLGAAQRGRKAVVVTIDPARRLADALGMPGGLTDEPSRVATTRSKPSRSNAGGPDGDVVDSTAGAGELWAMMLNPTAMLKRVVERYAADAEQVERIVDNRLFQQLATSLSGTQEYMATEALYELANDDRFDLVIVDTPPSRQTLTFLESPGLLSRFLSHRLFRLMMLPTRSSLKIVGDASQALLRQVGKVVGSDVLTDATAFFQAFAGMDEGFRERAEAVDGVLRAPTTGFVLTAGPNADTVAEAVWFADRLRALGVDVSATIINRLVPAVGVSPGAATVSPALAANLDQMAALADAQRAAIAPLVTSAPSVTQVPLLGSDVHDQAALASLADRLFADEAD